MAVATQTPGFIFSADGKSAPSYADLTKRRKVFDALMAQQAGNRAPQNVGEGIFALGQGIAAGIQGRALRKQEEALGERQKQLWSDLSAIGPGGAGAGYGSATGAIGDGRYTTADLASGSTSPVSTTPGDEDIFGDFIGTVKQGVTNPYGLAAVASTGKRESGYSAGNAYRQWSDPSESGQAGQAGGIMSWRAERLQAMRDFVAGAGGDPNRPSAALQAQFFLNEDPGLIQRLNGAKSVEEAQQAMNQAWAFAGWDRPGGEAAARMDTARSYLPQFMGDPSQQSAPAPVQVASLDPSAGMAQATQKGASVSTTTQVGAQRPQPANVPIPTAREALEKAFAAQGDPSAMSSIAPAGMPGSNPQTEAAIQQYAAANGTTPLPYQGGGSVNAGAQGKDPLQAEGSSPDRVAEASIQNDPSLLPPIPTPRPEVAQQVAAQQGGIPQQAVAASAMAQQPAPFDPVNGTAMGGNTGAADAAKAAYLRANGASPAVRTVAEAMNRTGATVSPAAPADPVRSEAVQRVATAQNQAQAQGRFGQLMQIMMDPSASPEQRQVANMYLERDAQFQTQQQAREWEMLKMRQEWAREDQRNAVTDRREDRRDAWDREKFGIEQRKPVTVDGRLVNPETGSVVYEAPRDPISLPQGNVLVSPDGRRIAENPKGPDVGANFEREQNLRKEYGSTAEVKEYADIRSSYERLRASAQTGSGPGDLGVIFGYMKMLDPGSVVREGEFATAETAQGVPERVINLYNKLLTGERLTPDQRKSFVTAAGDLYGQVERKMQGINERYDGISRQYGVDPTRVIQSLPRYEPLTYGQPEAVSPAAPAPTRNASSPRPTTAGAVDYYDQSGQGWKGGVPVGGTGQTPQARPTAPSPGNYRWNHQTNRMEPM